MVLNGRIIQTVNIWLHGRLVELNLRMEEKKKSGWGDVMDSLWEYRCCYGTLCSEKRD